VPWCEECSKYLTPNSVRTDGACPSCGKPVGDVERRAVAEADDQRMPWHFKLLVGVLVIYLGWRIVQLITWLF
jgi:hypothetical protein